MLMERNGRSINRSTERRAQGGTSIKLPRFGNDHSRSKQESLRKAGSTTRYIRPLYEEHEDDFYDDSISFAEYDDDVSETTMESGDERDFDVKNICEKLDIVLKKLAKIEEAINNLSGKEVAVKITEGAETSIPSEGSMRMPKAGSMLADIQSTLGAQMPAQFVPTQSGLGPMSMGTMSLSTPQQQMPVSGGTMSPNMIPQIDSGLSAIATMPQNAYEDDAPVIIGLD